MEKQENYSRHYSVLTNKQIPDYTKIPNKKINLSVLRPASINQKR
jgi:hypothetical protein